MPERAVTVFKALLFLMSVVSVTGSALPDYGPAPREPVGENAVSSFSEKESKGDDRIVKVWVFFSDHGNPVVDRKKSEKSSMVFSPRAEKRIKNRSDAGRISPDYRPVCRKYIDLVRGSAVRVRTCSRYFNAVSIEIRAKDIEILSDLSFVRKIEPVRIYRRKKDIPQPETEVGLFIDRQPEDRLMDKYGPSLGQLAMIESLDLLEAGYNGSGEQPGTVPVLVCILDTGFDLTHEALSGVSVIAQYDFVQHDTIISDQAGDYDDQGRHGTAVLGTIAGYREGYLIGPAWGADYILAKTEIVGEEINIEEDNWIAGIEWADSIGADIVTSSLGYIDWYTSDSLDGETCLCTIAADKAVSHGITVVNSAGNYGYLGPVSIMAPADGDSVIAVGAVDRYGEIAWFSSHGPTADGRIKPDIVAQGEGVISVSYVSEDQYSSYNGTSFSAPLIAGLCAQLLELHPYWSPIDLRDSLVVSASRCDDPDNIYGYGIPHGYLASGLIEGPLPESMIVGKPYPNPFSDLISIDLFLPEWEVVHMSIYDSTGRLVRVLLDGKYLRWGRKIVWDGTNRDRSEVACGVYFLRYSSETESFTFKVVRIR